MIRKASFKAPVLFRLQYRFQQERHLEKIMEEELIYLNALNRVSFLGPVRIAALLKRCGSSREAWHAAAAGLVDIPELKGFVERLLEESRRIDPLREWRRLQQLNIVCLSLNSPEYPPLLKEIPQPPPLLYCRGRWLERDSQAVAIVGSRRCTFYGREVASRLAADLASAGFTVVSGMALGIDTAAHEGALEAGGRTIAVLGCSVERSYPAANRDLMEQIINSGAVISEFSLDTPPLPQHFPRRNRIISGLALGTVVVEASQKSGALITAFYALDQNREVFAVPGNVGSPYSRGCHRLIKEGARLVETAEDIIEELGISAAGGSAAAEAAASAKEQKIDALEDAERRLLELIPYHPLHIDEIVRLSGADAARAGAYLISLELKGLVRQLPGKYFIRR
ncbi:MAG: DNA-processing protein DprA [Dethiobacteria bacterium]|nr:DNA-processing protein DprA [Bacillota bacterium]HOJ83836.1 DNA-processing protein DprA [Bacillota bacterium]HOL14863.1 DNA-processing protein DprA [Bacillota bacterium]